MNNKLLLIVAGILIVIGLIQPDLSSLIPSKNKVVQVELSAPADDNIKKECEDVIDILQHGDKIDALRLRDLYIDIATLISLDGKEEVIKNTEEIRQANSLAGVMLKLDIKGKYPNLAQECKDVIVTVIGEDMVPLSSDLREKASQSFKYLAWACNEGSK